jgi:Ca-activated chloride channel homolog
MFDNSFQWAVPIRKADDKAFIKRLISGIVPDGGTQIAPALTESYKRIIAVDATFRHIVLLTDGISEEGDSLTLSKEAVNSRVTISTVGLGQDVNRTYLDKIAEYAKGKSYFLNDPSGLEQILLRDVKEHTGTTAIEKPIRALVKHPSDLLDQVDVASAPPLAGYVRFETRPTADEILEVDEHDPLLVRWQYGLGRAVVFASDAKSRWAASWVGWNGFDRLWTNIFRDLLPHGNESEAVARYDAADEEIAVEYHLSNRASEPSSPPDLYVIGPGDFRRPLEVSRVSPGTYRGRVHIGALEGLFRIRPLNETRAFPEVGLYRQESELSDYGTNDTLLRSLAQATGGRFNPSISELFNSGGQSIESALRLWPGLLCLALLLNLLELVLRKWRGIAESFRSRQTPPTRLAA